VITIHAYPMPCMDSCGRTTDENRASYQQLDVPLGGK
jgi:hypothetical protein